MFPWREKCDLLLLLFNIFSFSVNFSVDENSHSDFYFFVFFLRYEDNSVLLKLILFFLSFCFNEPSLVEVKVSRTEV